ncbi:MAG: hypothetical protein J6U51_07600 [Bacteroidales bacterium]|nr:hypothetical protein [Bacteroidales bacterium]
MELNKKQIGRLITAGRRIWKSLTPEEQEAYYYDTGTIGFVEDVAKLLHLHIYNTSLTTFEAIHRSIFSPYTR